MAKPGGGRTEDPQDAPEADLVEAPADQRKGVEPEDLLRVTEDEQRERDARRRRRP